MDGPARDCLNSILEELRVQEFKDFKLHLEDVVLKDESVKIPRSKLEKAQHLETADLMIRHFKAPVALEMARMVLEKMNRRDLSEIINKEIADGAQRYETSPDDYRKKYTQHILEEFKDISDHNTCFGEAVSLKQRYTKLLLRKKHLVPVEREDNIRATWREHHEILATQCSDEYLYLDINSLFDEEAPRRTIVLQGPAGIGKTVTAQKMILDWASGQLYQDRFDYAFYINCREINVIKEHTSVADLILNKCPDRNPPLKSILQTPERLLFIIDGFDELSLDVKEQKHHIEPSEKVPVDILMSSLLGKMVLTGCYLVVTTRTTAMSNLEQCVKKTTRVVEIMGFSEKDKKEYFYKFFKNELQASQAFQFVKQNEMVHTMCIVPIVCWIICTVIQQEMESSKEMVNAGTLKTTTSVYMLFFSSLLEHHCSKENQSWRSLIKLFTLAKEGISEQHIFFDDCTIKKHGLENSHLLSLFLIRSTIKQGINRYSVYSFIHLSFQEFFAALFYVLDRPTMEFHRPLKHIKQVLMELDVKRHFMLTVRFMFGLLSEECTRQVKKVLKWDMSHKVKPFLWNWLEAEAASKGSDLWIRETEIFLRLLEIQDKERTKYVMDNFTAIILSGLDPSTLNLMALSFCLENSHEKKSLQLNYSMLVLNNWKSLTSGMLNCSVRLEGCQFIEDKYSLDKEEELSDDEDMDFNHAVHQMACNEHVNIDGEIQQEGTIYSVVELRLDMKVPQHQGTVLHGLWKVLRHPSCTLKKLGLINFNLSDTGCADLFGALGQSQSLVELELNNIHMDDSVVCELCKGLKYPGCKLQKLRLALCSLTPASCAELACVCNTHQSLIELELTKSNVEEVGVTMLCEAVTNPSCKLQTLRLSGCNLTAASCGSCALVLSANTSLIELDISHNILCDSEVRNLCKGLKHPNCHLQRLNLSSCRLKAAAWDDLFSVLCSRTSLIQLDMSSNFLIKSRAYVLFEGLAHSNCKLQKLTFNDCPLTELDCANLSFALSKNPHLKELDLRFTNIHDLELKQLCAGLKHPNCKLQKLVLAGCHPTAASLAHLSDVLCESQSLIELDLTAIVIEESGMKKLCKGLEHPDCKLQILRLTPGRLTSTAKNKLKSLKKKELRIIWYNTMDSFEITYNWNVGTQSSCFGF